MSEKVLGFNIDDITSYFYGLNWIKILDDAIKQRPTSWNDSPVREWRNASDTICNEVLARIRRDLQIYPSRMWAKDDKEPKFRIEDCLVPVVSLEWLEDKSVSAVKAIKAIKEGTEFDRGFKAGAIQATINILAEAKFDLGWEKFKEEKNQKAKI